MSFTGGGVTVEWLESSISFGAGVRNRNLWLYYKEKMTNFVRKKVEATNRFFMCEKEGTVISKLVKVRKITYNESSRAAPEIVPCAVVIDGTAERATAPFL